MKASAFPFSLSIILLATVFTNNGFSQDKNGASNPDIPVHQLVDYGKSGFDEVKILSGLDLNDIESIAPVTAGISYSKVRTNHNEFGMVAYDRQQLNRLFGKTFVLELQKSKRYSLVAKPAADSILLTIKIEDFTNYLQPIEARTQSQVPTVASCRLSIEVREMKTGAVILTISDKQKIRLRRHLRDNETVASMAETKKVFQKWATDLKKLLEKLG